MHAIWRRMDVYYLAVLLIFLICMPQCSKYLPIFLRLLCLFSLILYSFYFVYSQTSVRSSARRLQLWKRFWPLSLSHVRFIFMHTYMRICYVYICMYIFVDDLSIFTFTYWIKRKIFNNPLIRCIRYFNNFSVID